MSGENDPDQAEYLKLKKKFESLTLRSNKVGKPKDSSHSSLIDNEESANADPLTDVKDIKVSQEDMNKNNSENLNTTDAVAPTKDKSEKRHKHDKSSERIEVIHHEKHKHGDHKSKEKKEQVENSVKNETNEKIVKPENEIKTEVIASVEVTETANIPEKTEKEINTNEKTEKNEKKDKKGENKTISSLISRYESVISTSSKETDSEARGSRTQRVVKTNYNEDQDKTSKKRFKHLSHRFEKNDDSKKKNDDSWIKQNSGMSSANSKSLEKKNKIFDSSSKFGTKKEEKRMSTDVDIEVPVKNEKQEATSLMSERKETIPDPVSKEDIMIDLLQQILEELKKLNEKSSV